MVRTALAAGFPFTEQLSREVAAREAHEREVRGIGWQTGSFSRGLRCMELHPPPHLLLPTPSFAFQPSRPSLRVIPGPTCQDLGVRVSTSCRLDPKALLNLVSAGGDAHTIRNGFKPSSLRLGPITTSPRRAVRVRSTHGSMSRHRCNCTSAPGPCATGASDISHRVGRCDW